jgi:hypothetical protein
MRSLLLSFAVAVAIVPVTSFAKTFLVSLDTRALATQPAPPAPFSLDLQLIDGGGRASNIVVISNIDFGPGGRARGAPTITGGGSGDLSGVVVLSDTAFLNEFVQPFTPSASQPLTFTVEISEYVETPTPDSFSIGILDASGNGLSTQYFDAFMQLDITATPTPVTYAADPNTPPPGCATCAPIALPAPTAQVASNSCDMVAANDVTVSVRTVTVVRDHGSFLFFELLTLKNPTGKTIDGPLQIALDGLRPGVTLVHSGGVTTCAFPPGSPLVAVRVPRLRPNVATVIPVLLRSNTNAAITFTPRVLHVSKRLDDDDEERPKHRDVTPREASR